MTEKSGKLTVVSLFSGAGGLDIAACSTGTVGRLFSTDSNHVFLQTVIDNLPRHFPQVEHRYLVIDARDLTGDIIREILGTDKIDMVMGGPPCDDFTSTGRKRGLSGEKAPLIFEYARLIDETKPGVFIFENVPNLKRMCTNALDELMFRLSNSGYSLKSEILDASYFGVPSIRKRLFIIGYQSEKAFRAFSFPEPTHGETSKTASLFNPKTSLSPFTRVGDVLKDIPDVTAKGAECFLNHTGRKHRPGTIKHIMKIPQGVAVNKSYRYRAPWDALCRSLTAGVDDATKSYIHPIFHREMSVREYARIHGFPDSWAFNGSHHNGIKQVANAVPIPLGAAVVAAVTRVIKRQHI